MAFSRITDFSRLTEGPRTTYISTRRRDSDSRSLFNLWRLRGIRLLSRMEVLPLYVGDGRLIVEMPLDYSDLMRLRIDYLVQITAAVWWFADDEYDDPMLIEDRQFPLDCNAAIILTLHKCLDVLYDRAEGGDLALDVLEGLLIHGVPAPIFFDYDSDEDGDFSFDFGTRPRRPQRMGGGRAPLAPCEGPGPSRNLNLGNFQVNNPNDTQSHARLQFEGFGQDGPAPAMNAPGTPNPGAVQPYDNNRASTPSSRGGFAGGRGGFRGSPSGPGNDQPAAYCANQPPAYSTNAALAYGQAPGPAFGRNPTPTYVQPSAPTQLGGNAAQTFGGFQAPANTGISTSSYGERAAPPAYVSPAASWPAALPAGSFGGFSDPPASGVNTQPPSSSQGAGRRRGGAAGSGGRGGGTCGPIAGPSSAPLPPPYQANATPEYPSEKRGWH